MACEELELLTDIHDFTTPCYVILRHQSIEWLELSIRYGNCHMVPLLSFHDFAFFKHSFWCKSRLLKRVLFAYFHDQESEIFISVIRDPPFFPFVNHARDALYASQ